MTTLKAGDRIQLTLEGIVKSPHNNGGLTFIPNGSTQPNLFTPGAMALANIERVQPPLPTKIGAIILGIKRNGQQSRFTRLSAISWASQDGTIWNDHEMTNIINVTDILFAGIDL